jgi:hypothetical protein
MRRVLYTLLVLALLVPAGSVFAEPQIVQQTPDGQWVLGEVWTTPDDLFGMPIWEPFERVDAFMTRPAASYPDGWPFEWGPVGFWEDVDPWWWSGPQSAQRRMSYAEDWFFASEWGGYYAEFLLPRDEVWYPCDWPLQWKCDYEIAAGVWEVHSPQLVIVEPDPADPWGGEIFFLNWPPFDTISPVVIDIQDAEKELGVQYQLEIIGYTYYASDIP